MERQCVKQKATSITFDSIPQHLRTFRNAREHCRMFQNTLECCGIFQNIVCYSKSFLFRWNYLLVMGAMADLNFYRNFYDERILDKTLFMEMNEASCGAKKNFPPKTKIVQPKDIPCIQIQGLGSNQGSVLSLATRSIIDQSDEQPLTEIHACRYDECNKFHSKPNREAAESPASSLKNLCLFSLIGLLILWIIIYTLLVQYKVL